MTEITDLLFMVIIVGFLALGIFLFSLGAVIEKEHKYIAYLIFAFVIILEFVIMPLVLWYCIDMGWVTFEASNITSNVSM